jgi:SPOR domain
VRQLVPFCFVYVSPIAQVLERLDPDSTGTLSTADARKEGMPLVWIPVTLCVGLLIAAIYLGGRILTAHSQAAVPVQTPAPVQTSAPFQTPELAQTSEPAQTNPAATLATDDEVHMIAPQAGQQYLQIGALNLEETRRYIEQLRQAKLEPHVAPGPRPELLRVLIGPFADQDALTRAKDDLARAGIKNFVRRY